MKSDTPGVPLLVACLKRGGGPLGGYRVGEFVCAWALATAASDHSLTSVDEFLEWWRSGYSERTAYRRLALFREAFPELGERGTPAVLVDPIVAEIKRRKKQPKRVDSDLLMVPIVVPV